MRYSIVLLALAIMYFAVPAQGEGTSHTLSDVEIAMVQESVRRDLVDPASAQFGPIIANNHKDGKVYTCGFVNAKNRMGGFTGDTPFMVVLSPNRDNPAGRALLPGPNDPRSVIAVCRSRGVTIARQ